MQSDTSPTPDRYHQSDHGYAAHWRRVGPMLDEIRRRELRDQGTDPTDWRIIDSLLQFGYLHGNRNPPTGLIEWQARLSAAHAKHAATNQSREM